MAKSWQLKQGRKTYLPLTTARIERWIAEGKVTEEDLVWRPGFAGWKRIGEVEEFKAALRKKPPEEKKL